MRIEIIEINPTTQVCEFKVGDRVEWVPVRWSALGDEWQVSGAHDLPEYIANLVDDEISYYNKNGHMIGSQTEFEFEAAHQQVVEATEEDEAFEELEKRLTGGPSSYYDLTIERWTNPEHQQAEPVTVCCNDIIEALGMSFAEGNIFKAVWRRCAERLGNGKPGVGALYDAEKIVFFGERLVEQSK